MSALQSHLGIHRLFSHAPPVDGLPETAEATAARHRLRVEVLIRVVWGIIFVKSLVVVWAVHHYQMPFSPFWVIGPTVGFAALATAAYYYLRD